MSRFKKSFSEDELIISKTHRSFLSLIPTLLICGIIVAVVAVLAFVVLKDQDWLTDTIKIAVLASVAGISVLIVLITFLKCFTTKAVITNYRLVCSKGILINSIVEIPIARIDNIFIKQGLFGRMFRYGVFKVFTSSSMYSFSNLAKVYKFKTSAIQTVLKNKHELMEFQAKEISKVLQGDISL